MSKSPFIRLQKNLENLIDTKEDKTIFYGGILGTFDSLGNEIVDVPGRSSFSYVRLNGSVGEVIEAFNITVSAEFGLKVKVAKKPGEFFYEVVGLDLAQYSDWGDGGSNPFLPKHAFTHSFGAGTNVGTDPVFIYKRQLLQPMGMQPVNTGTAFYGYVNPDFYIWNNDINYFEGQYTANLSGLKPTDSQSRYVTVYLRGDTGILGYKTGSLFTPPNTVSALIANIPEVNLVTEGLPLNAVYLTSGTTSVNWDNMFDIRNFLNAGGSGIFTGTSGGGTTVTGIAEGAVLFGSSSGTITWDVDRFKWLDSTDQLLLGTSSLPFTSTSRITITQTGNRAGMALIGYGEHGGAYFGRAVNGTQTNPSGTAANLRLLNLEAAGYGDSEGYTSFRARLAAISQTNWVSGSTPAYWEMWATPTGSAVATVVHRNYGSYEESLTPHHIETLRVGTGSIYSQFIKSTGQSLMIPYVLPPAQGVAGSFLGNDGNGNLSWIVITVTGSGGDVMSGYPTGIPDNAVLFGKTGTISYDVQNFVFLDTTDQLVIGASGVPISDTNTRLFTVKNGDLAQISQFSYSNGGGVFAGYGIAGSISGPTGTKTNDILVELRGGGYDGTFYPTSTRMLSKATRNWTVGDNPGYWEIYATQTGSSQSNVVHKWYSDYQVSHVPISAESIRIGTGSAYTEIARATGQSNRIAFVLPQTQGVNGTVLTNDGLGYLSWTAPITGSNASIVGIPTGAILFGSPTGTIMWDTEFTVQKNVVLGNNQQMLLIGPETLPHASTARIFATRTGVAAFIELVAYAPSIGLANESGGRILGRSISYLPSAPSGTAAGARLISLEGAGYVEGNGASGYRSRIASYTPYKWAILGDNPTYWEIQSTPTGTNIPNTVQRIFGNYEQHYYPVEIADQLRFGTGSNYTTFSKATGQSGIISYILPQSQGASSTFLKNDGSGNLSWGMGTGLAGGTPGGSDKQVQYNQGGAFGGEAGFEYNYSTNILSAPNLTLGFSGTFAIGSDYLHITSTNYPAQITSNQNDYSPSEATTLYLSSDAEREITGLNPAFNEQARIRFLINVGSNNIILKNQSASSSADYRFDMPGDFTLKPDMIVLLHYDPTNQRWKVLGAHIDTSSGGYPTGIPNNVILYGVTGTIGWQSDFIITGTKVGIGTSSPLAAIHTQLNGTSFFRGFLLDQYSNDDDGSTLWFRKSRGTSTIPTGVFKNDNLGEVKFAGYDSVSLSGTVAKIKVLAHENFNGSARGTRLETYLTITGTANTALISTLYGNYEEHYTPVHLDKLRFGTGSVYTQFSGPTGSASIIPYKLPEAQGESSTHLKNDASGNLSWGEDNASITFIVDGGGSAITTGTKGDLEIPFGCVIQRVTMLGDQTGTLVMDIWKDTYANYPPTVADSITASAPPKIATGVKGQNTTLTGWTTTVTAGDTLRFQVNNVTAITRATLSLKVKKT